MERKTYRLFLILVMTGSSCASLAYATMATSTFSVSVTVIDPTTAPPLDAEIMNNADQPMLTPNGGNNLPQDTQANASGYQRFSATDSVEKRGEVFP